MGRGGQNGRRKRAREVRETGFRKEEGEKQGIQKIREDIGITGTK